MNWYTLPNTVLASGGTRLSGTGYIIGRFKICTHSAGKNKLRVLARNQSQSVAIIFTNLYFLPIAQWQKPVVIETWHIDWFIC